MEQRIPCDSISGAALQTRQTPGTNGSLGIQPTCRGKPHKLDRRGDLDITNWLAWFLVCLDQTIGRVDKSLSFIFYKARLWQRINFRPVNDRQRKIINRMLDDFQGHLSTSKHVEICRTGQVLNGYSVSRYSRAAGPAHNRKEPRRRKKY